MSRRTSQVVLKVVGFAVLASVAVLGTGCKKKPKFYDSKVEITRFDIVRTDAAGKPVDADVEFNYFECPGEQVEVIRGGAEFAECMKKYKVGDKVPVRIEYHVIASGYMDWDIHEMGGCKRPPDEEDEASFDVVQECEPIAVNGVEEGFTCTKIPKKALLKKCPWFARH